MAPEVQQAKTKPGQESALPQAVQAPSQVAKPKATAPASAPTQTLDQVIQSAFGSLEEGAYRQAIELFQRGLQIADNPRISLQLNIELAKIHHTLSEQETALKHIDAALELSRENKNGAAEQEILSIRTLIATQNSA